MKLNNIVNATIASIALALLYLIFPIIPSYVLPPLIVLVIALTIMGREGLSTFILLVYVILSFIASLGRAVVIVLPTLIASLLIVEPGIVGSITLISWALLFTPLYWLSVPLSITPSIYRGSVRGVVTYVLLLFNYVIAQSSLGINWEPITRISLGNVNIISGFYSVFTEQGLSLSSLLSELSLIPLYYLIIVLIMMPLITSLVLSKTLLGVQINKNMKLVVNYVTPELLTVALLYIPYNPVSMVVSPLMLIGSILMGLALYGTHVIEGVSTWTRPEGMGARAPIVIPMLDHLMLMEYGGVFKKVVEHSKEYGELMSKVIEVINNKGSAVVFINETPNKLELMGKSLLGASMSKGFVVMGDIEQIPTEVLNYSLSHGAALVLIPNKLGKGVIKQVRDLSRARRFGIVILTNNEEVMRSTMRNNLVVLTQVKPSITIVSQTKAVEETVSKPMEAKQPQPVEEVKRKNLVTTSGATTPQGVEQPSAVIPKQPIVTTPRSKAKPKEHRGARARVQEVHVSIDPLDLVHESVKSKLINYVDSAVRLKDMMKELGIGTASVIMIVGPSKSGKTALVNYVAKQLGLTVVGYDDPSITMMDNVIVHVPNLRELMDKAPNVLSRLVDIVRMKHMALLIECDDPWGIDSNVIKNLVDRVVVIEPADSEELREIIGRLKLEGDYAKYALSILSTCPPVEAVEKLKQLLSGDQVSICVWNLEKYREFASSFRIEGK
ncbi:hypothetical protein [Vulcanisaeta thermophila]|uniref:hypothetical protein n=1 Tax=Vulcanisaeta thermophila TaxID=867917 RepID=UPI000852E128|nr:hypothetical protein [Vulcanisaeta thermophila]